MLSETGMHTQEVLAVDAYSSLNQALPPSFFEDLAKSQENDNAHELRVSAYSYAIAKTYGLSPDHSERIRSAAVFHDIGKLMIPETILDKPSTLDTSERETIKTHTLYGYELLRGSSEEVLREAAEIALYHHERFDGKGYPHGLKAHEIPISARIVAVADVFDALSTNRVYRAALPEQDVLTLMRNASGTHFDPKVIRAFEDTLSKFPYLTKQLKRLTA